MPLPTAILDSLPWFLRGFRDGVEVSWSHSWPWPHWVAVFGLLLLVVLLAGITWREPIGSRRLRVALAVLRILLAGVLVWMMYGWLIRPYRTERPELVIILDQSSSMAREDVVGNSPAGTTSRSARGTSSSVESRFQAAQRLLRDGSPPRRLAERYRVRCYVAGVSASELATDLDDLEEKLDALTPSQEESRLGRCLQEALDAQRGRPTAAVVYFTDGATTEGPSLAEAVRQLPPPTIPLYVVGLGSEQAPRDVWLADVLVETTAFVDDWLLFEASVRQRGFEGKTITARLRQLDDETVVAESPLVLPADDQTQTVQLAYRAGAPGEHRFRVELEPFTEETQRDNNQLERTVTVRDESIRVLFVQAYPSHEFHFLKRFLGRSLERGGGMSSPAEAERLPEPVPRRRTFQLSTVLQEADLEYADQDETALRVFPVQREDLFAYDVIIFGDVNPAGLAPSSLQHVADFVTERGGGLVVLAGPRYTPSRYAKTPLESLLPVRLDGVALPAASLLTESFRVRPSPFGLQSPPVRLASTPAENARVWQTLPGLYWLLNATQLRPAARTLVEAADRTDVAGQPLPVVTTQFVGAGKVVFHATDETYRWSRSSAGEQFYERYWLQMLRYLSRSKLHGADRELELTTDRGEYRRGDTVLVRARFLDERQAPDEDSQLEATLERGSGPRRTLLLQRKSYHRGVFETQVADLPVGRYQVWLARDGHSSPAASPRFEVVAPQVEQERITMDGKDLREAARLSRGRFYTAAEANRLWDELPRGERMRTEPLPPEPIWNSPLLAGLVVLCMTAIWTLRKRAGLP